MSGILHKVDLMEDEQCDCQAIKWQNGFTMTHTIPLKTN